MADQTQGSIVIEADPAVIMAEIADYAAYPEWSSEIKKVEIRSTDDAGRGKHVYFEVASGPLKADYVLDYTYKPADEGLSWSFVEGTNLRDMQGDYDLQAEAPGKTTVTYTLKVDTPIPMMGFMKRQVEKKIIDVALKGLKKRVESRS